MGWRGMGALDLFVAFPKTVTSNTDPFPAFNCYTVLIVLCRMGVLTWLVGEQNNRTPNLLTSTFLGKKKKKT